VPGALDAVDASVSLPPILMLVLVTALFLIVIALAATVLVCFLILRV
jgi:hypothetical protein